MTDISDGQAIDLARRSLGLDLTVPARVFEVTRLDQTERSYFLVIFGEEGASVAISAVDIKCADIQTSAVLNGERPHLAITSDAAVRVVASTSATQTDLVWQPCEASLSPLYPLWRVRSANSTSYVDLNGKIWRSLRAVGPGGAQSTDG